MADRAGRTAERKQAELQLLTPFLLRIDIEALRRLEEQYQRERHRLLYGMPLSDREAVLECHSEIKNAHLFVEWVASRIDVINGNERG